MSGAPGDGRDPVAELGGVLQAEVAQPADALDGDERAGAGVDLQQRAVGGQAGAQQRGRLERAEPVGDADQPAGPGEGVLRVPAVDRGARPRLVGAVDEVAPAAEVALVVLAAQVADADPLADVPGGHAGADGVDDADDLVAGDDRLGRVGAQPLDGDDVGVADAAALDPEPHLPRRWLTELAV